MELNKPNIITTNKLLPFGVLEPEEFEKLCLWLVDGEGFIRPQHFGAAGSDNGRDIVAYRPTDTGEELWYFQCKRYKKISSSVLKSEVDKYNQLVTSDPLKQPFGIVFITSADVSARTREEVTAYCRKQGYLCEFWARTELDMRVKKHPRIVAEFFGVPAISTIPAINQLPPPPRDFTGRSTEMAMLTSAIEHGSTILSLSGMGGVGKTALALNLAEGLTKTYTDAHIYLDLKGTSAKPLSTVDAMRHIIRSYQPGVEPPRTEIEAVARYRSVLYDQRAILLLDNAASREQVAPLIPSPSCMVLVTSRERFHLPGAVSVHIESLSREDSHSLLLSIAPRIEDQVDTIAELCGYLPLALCLAGSLLAERIDLGVADYVRRLSHNRERLGLAEASLRLSYDLLIPVGQELWRKLAAFPGTFDIEGAAYVWGLEDTVARDVLSELVRYSLLEWDAAKSRYLLHDLSRLFAEERMSDAERSDVRLRHANYYGAILEEANSLYIMGGAATGRGLSNLELEWDNIRAAQAWAAENTETNDVAAEMCNSFPNAGAYVLSLRQDPLERIHWLEAALAAARKLNARQPEGAHLANIGITYTSIGNPRRAIELLEQSLVIDRELGDREGEAQVLGNLGNAYSALGEPGRAIGFYEQDLAVVRQSGDRRGEGAVLNNLGNAYAAVGKTDKAIAHYKAALAILDEIGGPQEIGGVRGSLGLLYSDLGEHLLSIQLLQQALSISRELGDMRGEGHDLGNLGLAFYRLGDYQNALTCHEEQLAIALKRHDRHGEASALAGLGSVHFSLGKDTVAVNCYRQAVEIFREIGDRYMESRILGNWGNLYVNSSDAHRAVGFYSQQLVLARELGDRRGEATALWNTGWAFNKLGDFTQAISYGEAALKIYDEIGDVNQGAKCRKYLFRWQEQLR